MSSCFKFFTFRTLSLSLSLSFSLSLSLFLSFSLYFLSFSLSFPSIVNSLKKCFFKISFSFFFFFFTLLQNSLMRYFYHTHNQSRKRVCHSQFHQDFTSSFCANRIKLIFLMHGVENTL